MEDTTRSRLTLFARLWPVSVILLLVFCVMFAYGVVDYKRNLMGIAAIGIFLTCVAQLAQFIVSIIAKRWWCMVGVILGGLMSVVILLFTVVGLAAGQYRPPKGPDVDGMIDTTEVVDYSFPVEYKGKAPAITDLVNAVLSQEELGEALGEMNDNWLIYQKKKALPKGKTFLVDNKKAYVRYISDFTEEGDEVSSKNQIEFCSWDFNDGKRKLLVEIIVCYQDGEPIQGQYSGLTFYVFDPETNRMEFTYDCDLDAEMGIPEGTEVIVHKLDLESKSIEYTFVKPTEKIVRSQTWNGDIFLAK